MLVLNNFTHDARVHKEAKTLADAGYNVTVVALWKAGLAERESQSGYQIRRLRLRSFGWKGKLIAPLVKYLEFAIRFLRLANQEPANIYHSHDAEPLPIAWLAARRAKAQLVYDAHELETGRNFGSSRLSGIYQRVWAWPERAFIRYADNVITVNTSIAHKLTDLYGIQTPTVIMNCPKKQLPTNSNRLRDELGIAANLKIVLYQGTVAAGRGIETFAAAIQFIPNTVGVVLGEGPALEEFRLKVALGQWERIYLPGRVPLADLLGYTVSADVGVVLIQDTCLSYRYALPNKLFEYMQAGIPVVGSNLPEIARIIQKYKVGETADPDNPESVANALRRLLNDPKYYAQAKRNTAQVAAIFNWENESAKLLQLYQQFGKLS